VSALEFVFQNQAYDHADDGHDQAAEESGPETVDREADAKGLANLAGQPEQEGVDQQREQAQGQEDERAGQQLEQRAQEGVDQPEDERQPDDGCKPTFKVDSGDKVHRKKERYSINRPTQNKFCHDILLSIDNTEKRTLSCVFCIHPD